ncbi:hypothetical protein OVA13_13090 [Pseudoxanthomonas sp. SL93]|uniref:hypothetical protein n=1 Tax=Pseudoxanthomonas sp. SL93 TaxID=2995142 RepID=UPI002270D1AC|nr:hypothetical protein [Pseudoxanthomonas sp. SL93]WAC62320.1 hypothetical protein OVA13_13090 [Pseudoxanthomonas sp. SL93]
MTRPALRPAVSDPTPAPSPSTVPLTRFMLYAPDTAENAATIAARRALMSRKGVAVDEMNQRARLRREQASRLRRVRWPQLVLASALVAGIGTAWWGSQQQSQAVLLGGYAMAGVAVVALIARIARQPALSRRPLEHDYLPDEHLATADDIALLRRLAQADKEIEIAIAAWWRDANPIRKGDVRLALDVQRAKLG